MDTLQIAYSDNGFFVILSDKKELIFRQDMVKESQVMTFINPDLETFKYISNLNEGNTLRFLFSLYIGILTQVTGENVVLSKERAKFRALATPIFSIRNIVEREKKLNSVLEKSWGSYTKDKSEDEILKDMFNNMYEILQHINMNVFKENYGITF